MRAVCTGIASLALGYALPGHSAPLVVLQTEKCYNVTFFSNIPYRLEELGRNITPKTPEARTHIRARGKM